MSDAALAALATDAGLLVDWEGADGVQRTVAPDTLRAALNALGLPCANAGDYAESRSRLQAAGDRDFVTADVGAPIPLPGSGRLRLEDGEARDVADTCVIDRPGYHRLDLADRTVTLAVAPLHAPGVVRSWGLAAQIYSLRGKASAGFGDFAALADCARAAAAQGAQALAISPVHALFLADPHRFSPYSPSSRDFLNPLFAAPGGEEEDSGDLIDWPTASARRIGRLRAAFAGFEGNEDFDAFVSAGGAPLAGHALFEAIHAAHGERGGWQEWPAAFHACASASPRAAAWRSASSQTSPSGSIRAAAMRGAGAASCCTG
jgi:4-alpha-glucanotransferase